MALIWSIDKIENYQEKCWVEISKDKETGESEYELNSTTNALIWLTMGVGIREITKANAEEFAARVVAWEKAYGTVRKFSSPITLADVVDHIGLSTNASTKTQARFASELGKALYQDGREEVKKQKDDGVRSRSGPVSPDSGTGPISPA